MSSEKDVILSFLAPHFGL